MCTCHPPTHLCTAPPHPLAHTPTQPTKQPTTHTQLLSPTRLSCLLPLRLLLCSGSILPRAQEWFTGEALRDFMQEGLEEELDGEGEEGAAAGLPGAEGGAAEAGGSGGGGGMAGPSRPRGLADWQGEALDQMGSEEYMGSLLEVSLRVTKWVTWFNVRMVYVGSLLEVNTIWVAISTGGCARACVALLALCVRGVTAGR